MFKDKSYLVKALLKMYWFYRICNMLSSKFYKRNHILWSFCWEMKQFNYLFMKCITNTQLKSIRKLLVAVWINGLTSLVIGIRVQLFDLKFLMIRDSPASDFTASVFRVVTSKHWKIFRTNFHVLCTKYLLSILVKYQVILVKYQVILVK